MALHDLAFTLLALISEIIGTISGFGSSTFFVPMAVQFESFQLVLALTAMLHVVSNFTKLAIFRGSIPLKKWLPLAVPSVVLCGIGASLTSAVPAPLLQVFLGLVLILISASQFLFKVKVSSGNGAIYTSLSGFFTGLVGTGGAIRAAALRSMSLEKNTFVFVSAAIDIGNDVFRTGIYLNKGYMDWSQWHYLPLLAAAGIAGSWIGKQILAKIRQASFERLVTLFIFISGVSLVVEGS